MGDQQVNVSSVHVRTGQTTLIDCTRAVGGPINGHFQEILSLQKGLDGDKHERNVTLDGKPEYRFLPSYHGNRQLAGREDRYITSTDNGGEITTRVTIGNPHQKILDADAQPYAIPNPVNTAPQLILKTILPLDETQRPNTFIATNSTDSSEYLTTDLQARLEKAIPGLNLDAITRIDPMGKFNTEAAYAYKQVKEGNYTERGDPHSGLVNHDPAFKIAGVLKKALPPGSTVEQPKDVVEERSKMVGLA